MTTTTSLNYPSIAADNTDPGETIQRDWESLIADWKQSGLSQVAFCRLHNIKPHIFSYHKGKLIKNKKKLNKMVPVQLARDSALNRTLSSSGYILTLPNGATLSISDEFDPVSLKNLLALLGVCSC